MSDDNFLSRWSRRKHQVRQGVPLEEAPQPPAPAEPKPATGAANALAESPPEQVPMPSIESLTPDSDFSPFMRPEVDRGLRNQAMRTLFQDPRFNVMDGLDVYIDDYSKPDPLPEGWLEKMNQVSRLGAYEPPKEEAQEAEKAEVAEAAVALPEEPATVPPPAVDESGAGTDVAELEKPAEPQPPRHNM